jgi:hypothetical protein
MRSLLGYRCLRLIVLAAVVVICVAAAPAAEAKPASFTRWAHQWDAHLDEYLGTPVYVCAQQYQTDDQKAGECIAGFFVYAWPRLDAEWKRRVAEISRGQSTRCLAAIRLYRAAQQRNGEVLTAYYRDHLRAGLHVMSTATQRAPYSTLSAALGSSIDRAVRICG